MYYVKYSESLSERQGNDAFFFRTQCEKCLLVILLNLTSSALVHI